MEHQSVYFLAHHMRYKGGKTIHDVKKLDEQVVNYFMSTSIHDYTGVYKTLNDNYIDHLNTFTMSEAKAVNILYLLYRLRFAFEARVRQKDVCFLKVKLSSDSKDYNKHYLSPDQQFNLYLYMFNEDSSVLIADNYNYNSKFRKLVNIALDVMKNYT